MMPLRGGAQAEIHIVEGHGQIFVKPAQAVKDVFALSGLENYFEFVD